MTTMGFGTWNKGKFDVLKAKAKEQRLMERFQRL